MIWMRIGQFVAPTTIAEGLEMLRQIEESVAELRALPRSVSRTEHDLWNAQRSAVAEHIRAMVKQEVIGTGREDFSEYGIEVHVQERWGIPAHIEDSVEGLQWAMDNYGEYVDVDWDHILAALVRRPAHQRPEWLVRKEPYVRVSMAKEGI